MVRIRLARGGVKKKPYYRVVVADQRCKRDGSYLEHIGYYNPMVTENRRKKSKSDELPGLIVFFR